MVNESRSIKQKRFMRFKNTELAVWTGFWLINMPILATLCMWFRLEEQDEKVFNQDYLLSIFSVLNTPHRPYVRCLEEVMLQHELENIICFLFFGGFEIRLWEKMRRLLLCFIALRAPLTLSTFLTIQWPIQKLLPLIFVSVIEPTNKEGNSFSFSTLRSKFKTHFIWAVSVLLFKWREFVLKETFLNLCFHMQSDQNWKVHI